LIVLNMEKILLRNLRILRIFLALFLILGIFVNSVMAEACFCGEACLHSLQNKAKTRSSFPFHNRCSGGNCKSCNLEYGQTLKAKNLSTPTDSLKSLEPSFVIFFLTNLHFDQHMIEDFCTRLYAFLKFQYSPIYIQNLSLLL
jgi:hypothetical protein